jgi:hypothetical protein
MTDHWCFGTAFDGRASYSCSRHGKYEERGKWWCKTHLPSEVKARREARAEKWQADWHAERNRLDSAEAEAQRRASALTEQLGLTVSIQAATSFKGTVYGYNLVLPDQFVPLT